MKTVLAKLDFSKALCAQGIDLVSADREFISIVVLADKSIREKVGNVSCYSFPLLMLTKACKLAREVDLTTLDEKDITLLKDMDLAATKKSLDQVVLDMLNPGLPDKGFPYFSTDLIADIFEKEFELLWGVQAKLLSKDNTKQKVDWLSYGMQESHRYFSEPAFAKVKTSHNIKALIRTSRQNSLSAVIAFYECVCLFEPDGIVEHPQGPREVKEWQARLLTMGLVESDLSKYKPTGYIPEGAPYIMNQSDYYEAKSHFQILNLSLYNATALISAMIAGRLRIIFSATMLLDLFPESKYKVSLGISLQYSWLRILTAVNRNRPQDKTLNYAIGHEPVKKPVAKTPTMTNDLKTAVRLSSEQEATALRIMEAVRMVYNKTIDANAKYFAAHKGRVKVVGHTTVVTEVRKEYPDIKRTILTRAHNLAKAVYEESGRDKKPAPWPESRNEVFIKESYTQSEITVFLDILGQVATDSPIRETPIKQAVLKYKDGQFLLQIKYKNV